MKRVNWSKILVVWIALGVLVSGWFHIYPTVEYERIYDIFDEDKYELKEYNVFDNRDLSVLVTVVGGILIYGLKVRKS